MRRSCEEGGCELEVLYRAEGKKEGKRIRTTHARCVRCSRGWAWNEPLKD